MSADKNTVVTFDDNGSTRKIIFSSNSACTFGTHVCPHIFLTFTCHCQWRT